MYLIFFASLDSITYSPDGCFFQSKNSYLSSLIAGSFAAFICTPMDTIKTHVQYKLNISTLNTIKYIINKYGIYGFFRGSLWRALKSGPQFMITQCIYNLFTK